MSKNFFNSLAGYALTMRLDHVKKVTKYLAEDLVVKMTSRQKKPGGRPRQVEYVLTVGRPNYAEHKFIKACTKAGEKFPVRKAQYKYYKGKEAVTKN